MTFEPAALKPRNTVAARVFDRTDPPSGNAARVESGEPDVWQAFGKAVLGFHRRVYATAMCRCGRTVVECDVMAQARTHGLLPT